MRQRTHGTVPVVVVGLLLVLGTSQSWAQTGPWYCTHDCAPDCRDPGTPDECNVAPTDLDGTTKVSEDSQAPGSGSGVPDECEADCNFNSIPDEREGPALCGDVNDSGVVGVFDVLCVLSCIEDPHNPSPNCQGPGCAFADVDPCGGNGVINVFDVFAALEGINCQWTQDPYCCCNPP